MPPGIYCQATSLLLFEYDITKVVETVWNRESGALPNPVLSILLHATASRTGVHEGEGGGCDVGIPAALVADEGDPRLPGEDPVELDAGGLQFAQAMGQSLHTLGP